jgi:hypothetical protein
MAASPAPAYPHPHRKVIVRERHSYTRVVVRGRPYFYHYGHFYWRRPHGYVLIPPPMGITVSVVPESAIRLRFGPNRYYYYEGIYYRAVPAGYAVVPKPDTVYLEKEAASAPGDEAFREPKASTIEVLNSNGSKTPVRLEELDGGRWKGPQGEVYDSMPTQDQLRSAYGF